MNKNIVPDNFTLSLCWVDLLPVLFFGMAMILLGRILESPLFIVGAGIALISGAIKVLWKFIVVIKRRNIWPLFLQMRIAMPIGLILMIVGIFVRTGDITLSAVWALMTSVPTIVFFVLGIIGMVLMMIFAFTLDGSDAKSNWIEQLTNGIAQLLFFLGVLFML